MNKSVFEQIEASAKVIRIDLTAESMAKLASDNEFTEEQLNAIAVTLGYLQENKNQTVVNALLRMSRLPLKAPKTFENFYFDRLRGRDRKAIQELGTLSAMFAHENLAFIGPPGVGKTHLAMAYGRACCESGYKAYYLTGNELNRKLTQARNLGHESRVITSLVKPSCLIIDEIGRCVFDKANTRMFFDVIDRRYTKEGPNTTIFTSNKQPDQWQEFFSEDDTLLCTLDRVFDRASVYMFKGESYRGVNLRTIGIEIGKNSDPNSNQ